MSDLLDSTICCGDGSMSQALVLCRDRTSQVTFDCFAIFVVFLSPRTPPRIGGTNVREANRRCSTFQPPVYARRPLSAGVPVPNGDDRFRNTGRDRAVGFGFRSLRHCRSRLAGLSLTHSRQSRDPGELEYPAGTRLRAVLSRGCAAGVAQLPERDRAFGNVRTGGQDFFTAAGPRLRPAIRALVCHGVGGLRPDGG